MAKGSGPNEGKPAFFSDLLHKRAACWFLVTHAHCQWEGISSPAPKVRGAAHHVNKGYRATAMKTTKWTASTVRHPGHCSPQWDARRSLEPLQDDGPQWGKHSPQCTNHALSETLPCFCSSCCLLTLKMTLPGQKLLWHHPTKVSGVTKTENFALEP